MPSRKWSTIGDIQQLFRNVYGQGGWSPEYQRLLYQQGLADIAPTYQSALRSGVADLNQRGFYSAIPYSNLAGRIGGDYMRALTDYRRGISLGSAQAAEQQKARMFDQMSGIVSQDFLYWLQKMANKKGFGDVLGQLIGQLGPAVLAAIL